MAGECVWMRCRRAERLKRGGVAAGSMTMARVLANLDGVRRPVGCTAPVAGATHSGATRGRLRHISAPGVACG